MKDPIARFLSAFSEAEKAEPTDATAVALATVDATGRPHVRMVLLKGADARGFVFYTHRTSVKGRDLAAHPHAALCFHWAVSGVQVRVEGAVETVSEADSDAYFSSRPRESQLGAWASEQSQPLSSRQALLDRFAEIEAKYLDASIPRPPHWGGYRVVPDRIEFWTRGDHRLHDREVYIRENASSAEWRIERLNP